MLLEVMMIGIREILCEKKREKYRKKLYEAKQAKKERKKLFHSKTVFMKV